MSNKRGPGVVIIGANIAITLKEVLEDLINILGVSICEIENSHHLLLCRARVQALNHFSERLGGALGYHKYRVKQAYNKNKALTLRTLRELQPGDYVTHIDHGVGVYSGLQKIEVNGKLHS